MSKQNSVHVGSLTVEFFIPHSHSLKEKRSVLKRMKDRVRNQFNVSLAETGFQDKWQRSHWTFCAVGSDKVYIEGVFQKLIEFLDAGQHAELTSHKLNFYR